jgi:nucleoid-associated protein YejK
MVEDAAREKTHTLVSYSMAQAKLGEPITLDELSGLIDEDRPKNFYDFIKAKEVLRRELTQAFASSWDGIFKQLQRDILFEKRHLKTQRVVIPEYIEDQIIVPPTLNRQTVMPPCHV